jgi:hypothetical protein
MPNKLQKDSSGSKNEGEHLEHHAFHDSDDYRFQEKDVYFIGWDTKSMEKIDGSLLFENNYFIFKPSDKGEFLRIFKDDIIDFDILENFNTKYAKGDYLRIKFCSNEEMEDAVSFIVKKSSQWASLLNFLLSVKKRAYFEPHKATHL